MTSRKQNIIKRKGVPLNVVTLSSAKRTKIHHVTCNIRSDSFNVQENINLPYETYDNHVDNCEYDGSDDQMTHCKRKLKAAERWQAIENLAIDAVICSMGRPHQNCGACGTAPGIVRCYNCGPSTTYCEDCAIEMHKHKLFHHFMEIWQVNAYHTSCIVINLCNLIISRRLDYVTLHNVVKFINELK